MGRIDYFLQQLTAEEGGIGVVVIRTPKEDIWYALYIESVIYGEIEFHKDDEKVDVSVEDLRFVKIEDPDGSMTTLWVIPPGAESPVSETSNLDLGLPEGTKPFKFRSTFKDREAFYCNTGGEDLQFLEMLEANPLAKGNIVIADKDRKAFREKKKELLSVFSEIDRDRLRFFFVKSNIPYVEYWIVPKRTK
ncbi:MAG TPA: hypothetical protein VMM38_01610 [Aridibacter sp.]|nr:hypothetical protein [Aridibacter sp.]